MFIKTIMKIKHLNCLRWKRNKKNIICAWALLLLFATGQLMVLAHQHYKQGAISASKSNQPTLKEKCSVCDAMHHTSALLTQHVYFTPIATIKCHYQYKKSDVILIQLVLSSGRAPPVSIS